MRRLPVSTPASSRVPAHLFHENVDLVDILHGQVIRALLARTYAAVEREL